MAEYWKSTPSYWCKFCSQYVRDTSIERKNHEASAKHQNNIQRSLRELHKGQERDKRDKQAAKDEVARLNGMFGGRATEPPKAASKQPSTPAPRVTQPAAPAVSTAAQRKAHAEQLAAMGVQLPEELKKEVTGMGSYQVVNAKEAESESSRAVTVNRSLAEILAEAKNGVVETEEGIKSEVDEDESKAQGVLKRRAVDDDEYRDEEAAPKRKAWGSDFKRYPGRKEPAEGVGDLDALLSSVAKKKTPAVKTEIYADGDAVKKEGAEHEAKSLDAIPEISEHSAVKQEGGGAASAVVFKKRKGKK